MNPLAAMQSQFMDYPMEVTIETQAVCNAACTFCPYPGIDRKGEKMPDDLLNKLVDEMISWDRLIYLSPFKLSDPLLDKRMMPLLERVNAASDKIVIRMFTNGSPLTPSKIAEIAKIKRVAQLWISLNSHIPEEYERLMGLKFEPVAKKLDYLHSLEDFPHAVMLSCVGHPNEAFRRYCWERWPKFQSMAIKKDSWIGFTDPQYPTVPDTACSRWFELSVTARGEATTCCMSSGDDPRYTIGNLHNQTLYDVYNSPRWRSLRETMNSRKTISLEEHPCASCSY